VFPDLDRDNGFIPRLWASRKIGNLLEEIRLHGENAELKDEVIRLSKEFGIPTPYTSILVEEPREYQRRAGINGPLDRGKAGPPSHGAPGGIGGYGGGGYGGGGYGGVAGGQPAPPGLY